MHLIHARSRGVIGRFGCRQRLFGGCIFFEQLTRPFVFRLRLFELSFHSQRLFTDFSVVQGD